MQANNLSISRQSLIGLLFVQLVVLLPLAGVLPSWLLALSVLVWIWRFLLLQMRRGLPSRAIKLLLVFSSLGAIFIHFGSFIRLEAIVTLLCAVYCLKLLEMRTRRDAQLVCALSFFILCCVFLFDREILTSLYLLLVVWVLLAVLIGLVRDASSYSALDNGKCAGLLLAKALPLMLLLFLLAPRLPPLWTVPMAAHEGRTGLSDEMAPGDIARLTQSDELVFRARFNGPIPPKSELYWRALTLSDFDGRRWSRIDERLLAGRYGLPLEALLHRGPQSPWAAQDTAQTGYELLLEPSGSPWLYGLATVTAVDQPVAFARDYTLRRQPGALERANYRLHSDRKYARDSFLPGWLRRVTLDLPAGNPEARGLARRLKAQTGGDDTALISALLAYYRQQPFYYTLRPPLLSGDSVDQFLFQSQRGFCAHYAGSMVFVLRAAGVPARIVAGYQGGEIDPAGFVQVRQYDAHAWVEAWIPGQGWVSVDPTAAVAPSRIEQGLAEATEEEGSFLEQRPFSPLRYQHLAWLNSMRRQWDRMEYRWQRWVVGFDSERQQGVLREWLGDQFNWISGLVLIGAGAFCLGLYLLVGVWRQRVRRTPLERLFLRFCARLSRRGYERCSGETAQQLVARIAQEDAALAARADDFSRLYTRLSFDPLLEPGAEHYRLLKRYLSGL